MKEFKDLAGKWITATTTMRPTVTKDEIYDDDGNATGEYVESVGDEHYVEGEVKHITAKGWLVLDMEYRSSLYTYFLNPDHIVHIAHQERTPEARARDAERGKALVASKSKTKTKAASR